MKHLLDVVQVWHGDQHKETFLLVSDKHQKRKESMPAPDLRIKSERLKTLDINDACQTWVIGARQRVT